MKGKATGSRHKGHVSVGMPHRSQKKGRLIVRRTDGKKGLPGLGKASNRQAGESRG